MKRLRIERTKAAVFTASAIITLLGALVLQQPSQVWISILLGGAAAWFWWKVHFYTKQEEL